VDHKTVRDVRRELEARREIPKVQVFRGKDGRKYHFTTVPTESAAHARKAADALRKLGKKHPGKVIRVGKAARLASYLEYEEFRNGDGVQGTGSKNIKLVCCDFRSLDVRGVDLIFTDPVSVRFDEIQGEANLATDKARPPDYLVGEYEAASMRDGVLHFQEPMPERVINLDVPEQWLYAQDVDELVQRCFSRKLVHDNIRIALKPQKGRHAYVYRASFVLRY
jgi:hypothetical protein